MKAYLSTSFKISGMEDVLNIERTPLSDWRLPSHIFDLLQDIGEAFGERTAITYLDDGVLFDKSVQVTYRQLVASVVQRANFLQSLGLTEKDPVAILLPNIPLAHAYLWAAQTRGIACPINHMLDASQIASIISESGCKAVVALGPDDQIDIWEKVAEIVRRAPQVEYVVRVSGALDDAGKKEFLEAAGRAVKVVPDDQCLSHSSVKLEFEIERGNPAAAYFHTGGTTGMPKIAVLTHTNQITNAWMQAKVQDLEPGHVRLSGLPQFHVNGAIANALTLICGGANLVLCGRRGYRDAGVMRNFWRIASHYQANSFASVPTMLMSLMQIPVGDVDISTLKFARCGTAPLSTRLFTDFTSHTGVDLIEGYGLSEGTSIASVNPRYGRKEIGSIGIRLPYHEIKAVLLNDGEIERDCVDGESGTIVIRGPHVIPEYLGGRGASSFLENGWYNTGDLGRRDGNGYFWITGRAKDLIIRGGHNIDPGMIEQALLEHPAVENAAALGRPDRYTGEMPFAYVSLKQGRETTCSEELLEFVTDRIPERAAIPKGIRIIREMPLTAVGKIFKPKLREFATKDGYLEALGGLVAAYNLSADVVIANGTPHVKTVAKDLSLMHHDALREFIALALKTFVCTYELTFAWTVEPSSA
jgi:fatty-acyl-CoA synthase